MKKSIEKFLEFNGQSIYFLSVDGTSWIAIKPICEALGVSYAAQFKRVKSDPILGPALSNQTMQVAGIASNQLRKMTCISEKYVYGWIFSIQSDAPGLIEYKKQCYELLFNHFHGMIGGRKDLLIEKAIIQKEESELMLALLQDERYTRLDKLRRQKKSIVSKLSQNDQSVIESQRSLWFNEGENIEPNVI